MLRIRREQLDALDRDARVQYIERVADDLAASSPQISRDGRMALVEGAIRSCARYGIVEEADVRTYLDWMLRHGDDFDTQKSFAWAAEVLQNSTLDGSAKMHELRRLAQERAEEGTEP